MPDHCKNFKRTHRKFSAFRRYKSWCVFDRIWPTPIRRIYRGYQCHKIVLNKCIFIWTNHGYFYKYYYFCSKGLLFIQLKSHIRKSLTCDKHDFHSSQLLSFLDQTNRDSDIYYTRENSTNYKIEPNQKILLQKDAFSKI